VKGIASALIVASLGVVGCRGAAPQAAGDGGRGAPTGPAEAAPRDGGASERSDVKSTMVRKQTKVDDPSEEQIRAFRSALARAEAGGFKPLANLARLPDGARVEGDSRDWSERFLRPAFDPWRTPSKVDQRGHEATPDTPDVLRHALEVRIQEAPDKPPIVFAVTVTETVRYLRVDVEPRGLDLLALPVDQRATAIAAIAERALPMRGTYFGGMGELKPYEWAFQYVSLDEGARFSTNPGVDEMRMKSWTERVDGGIEGGHVYFFGFKCHAPSSGRLVLLDPQHWFDGKCWAPFGP
jgi:hypothetical protein